MVATVGLEPTLAESQTAVHTRYTTSSIKIYRIDFYALYPTELHPALGQMTGLEPATSCFTGKIGMLLQS